MTKLSIPLAALLLGVTSVACGTHRTEAEEQAQAGKSGGGAGHSAGAGEGGSAPTVTMSPSVMCGDKTCDAPSAALAQAASGLGIAGVAVPIACCVDSGSVCGTAPSDSDACAPRAVADSQCPSLDPGLLSTYTGGKLAGCCTDQGACGIDSALFGLGCTENSAVATMVATIPLVGSTIHVPAAQSCTFDAGVGEDAGL